MSLSDNYLKYYKNPTNDNLFNLLINIKKYEFENYYEELNIIFDYYKKSKTISNFCYLKSNGSRNLNNKYKFGPNSKECIRFIEKYLRNANNNKTLLIYNGLLGGTRIVQNLRLSLSSNINTMNSDKSILWQRDFEIKGQWNYDSHVKRLIKIIENLYEKYGKINLVAWPNIWICLTTNNFFSNWINENYYKVYIVNSDWDLSIKKNKATIIDQMIDWKSGVNFYTCQKEKKHFLPIFKIINNKCYNLLNLTKEVFEMDDYVILGKKIKKCDCGKKYLDFNIITHYKNKITNENYFINFENFYNDLKCQYINLQIYQNNKNEIFIFYCLKEKENFEEDKKTIVNFFMKNNLSKLYFMKDKYFLINKKRFSIWKCENIQVMDFVKSDTIYKLL